MILLTNGFTVFTKGNWSASTFVSSYLYVKATSTHAIELTANSDIGLITVAYVGWKLIKRTEFVSLNAVPLDDVFYEIDENPEPAPARPTGIIRYISWLWS